MAEKHGLQFVAQQMPTLSEQLQQVIERARGLNEKLKSRHMALGIERLEDAWLRFELDADYERKAAKEE